MMLYMKVADARASLKLNGENPPKVCAQHGLLTVVLRSARVVDQCHSDNIDVES